MSFQDLRRAIEGEIFDYPMLMHHLREYKKSRDKITLLLKNNSIIRIRKGLYIFGPDYRRQPISLELLANLIYGPSYISLEYALSKYGLIPERAYVVTNICTRRSKTFKTPVGVYSYKTRPLSVYPLGVKHVEIPHEGGYLIAEPEKALVDLISQQIDIDTDKDMKDYLYENMRMEKTSLQKLRKKLLIKLLRSYKLPMTLIKAIYD